MRSILLGIVMLIGESAAIQADVAGQTRPAAAQTRPSNDFWATVPRGICIWKNKPFSEEDMTAIARYPLVQTMIPNGMPWRPGPGNIALEIKKRNPQAVVIGYKNIVVHYDYHANREIFRQHPDWFIHDRDSQPLMHNNRRPVHDLRQPAMREWWAEDVHQLLSTPGFDGILIDAVTKVYYYQPILDALSAAQREQYADGFHAMMQETRKRCASQGLLIGNCLRAVHEDAGLSILRKYYDGSYLELFDTPMRPAGAPAVSYEEWVARGIEAVQRAGAEGKLIFLTMSPGDNQNDMADVKTPAARNEPVDDDKLYGDHEYKLAMFLVCAGERSYWSYQRSRNAAEDRRRWDPDFAEYHRPLGPPKGPAARTGFTYSREFEHASVRLDLVKREGRITWRTPAVHP